MSLPPRTIVLIGPPASGKGTHGKALGVLPGFCHFSTGQAFRNYHASSPEERIELREISRLTSRGELVADELALRIFFTCYDLLVAGGGFHPDDQMLVLDGIPRTAPQAAAIRDKFDIRKVFFFECDDAEIIRRAEDRAMKENRADDANMDIVRHRLSIYRRELPGLENSFDEGLKVRINSAQDSHRVLHQILSHLYDPINKVS